MGRGSCARKTDTVPAMRHIGTLIAAVVIGPLAWILLALGQAQSAQAFAKAQDAAAGNVFGRPVLLLAGAGILLGLIATLRFSPLGAVLTGVVYSASYLALLIDPSRPLDLLNHDLTVAGRHIDPTIPVRNGTSLLLGGALLVAVFSLQRWRRWPRPDLDAAEAVLPDEFLPLAPRRTRPLGAEGLGDPGWTAHDGTTARHPEAEPALAGRRESANSRPHSSWDAPR